MILMSICQFFLWSSGESFQIDCHIWWIWTFPKAGIRSIERTHLLECSSGFSCRWCLIFFPHISFFYKVVKWAWLRALFSCHLHELANCCIQLNYHLNLLSWKKKRQLVLSQRSQQTKKIKVMLCLEFRIYRCYMKIKSETQKGEEVTFAAIQCVCK